MTVERFKETASTSHQTATQTDQSASTAVWEDVGVRLARPGLFIAGLVMSAALTSGGAGGQLHVGTSLKRRREDVVAESSTADVEIDPTLLKDIRELFEQGASEFFHDGVHSNFSRRLLRTLALHGHEALHAIGEYLSSGGAKPDVVSETLRWLAEIGDPATLPQRWAILRRSLKHRSPRVRDGAILGFAALDDTRARPLLLEARHFEQISELRTLITQVLAQLDRAR